MFGLAIADGTNLGVTMLEEAGRVLADARTIPVYMGPLSGPAANLRDSSM